MVDVIMNEFRNGITMVVPAGAVNSKINVKVIFTNDYDAAEVLNPLDIEENDIPFHNAHCLSAQLAGTSIPASYTFKTDYAWVNTQTKEAEFAIQHPTHIHDFGGGCCWASWNINLIIEYRFGESVFTTNQEDEQGLGCLHPLEGGTNPPFSVKFEDGYTENGNVWMGVLIEPISYVLTITQIQ